MEYVQSKIFKSKSRAYQLHQFDDAGYGLEVKRVQSDTGQRIRLTRFRLHRRHLARIIAGVVARAVHRHHGLRHHVTPILTRFEFTTRAPLARSLARVHARLALVYLRCSHTLCLGVKGDGEYKHRESKIENRRTGTAPRRAPRSAGHLLYVHHDPRARRPLLLRTTSVLTAEEPLSHCHTAVSVPDQSEIRNVMSFSTGTD